MRAFYLLLLPVLLYGSLPCDSIVDECCCEVGSVDKANAVLNPLINTLGQTPYFTFFKLSLYKECPFWASETMCGISGGCAVCECDADEVPLPLRELDKSYMAHVQTPKVEWENNADLSDNVWCAPEDPDELQSYVNLRHHTEAYTGYTEDSSRIWRTIYKENCFQGTLDELCLEERVLYRVVSGLHASVSTHLCRKYALIGDAEKTFSLNAKDSTSKDSKDTTFSAESNHAFPVPGKDLGADGMGGAAWFSPNITMFYDRVGKHPDRMQNLYFTYLFLLRALHKASPALRESIVQKADGGQSFFDTGNPEQDCFTSERFLELLDLDILCEPSFDESVMFHGKGKLDMLDAFRGHFKNISMIMDCVACEKCKVFGKLQVLGLGTAMKIALASDAMAVTRNLQRNELVAFVNTLRQFSNSLRYIKEMSVDCGSDLESDFDAGKEWESEWWWAKKVVGGLMVTAGLLVLFSRVRQPKKGKHD